MRKTQAWKGIMPGNHGGDLWQTFNIDLARSPGRVHLSDKMRRLSTGLGVVTKFVRTNATATDQWFALTSGDILRNGNSLLISGTWISDNTTGTFNDPKDAVVHEYANGEERLLVSRETNIAILNSAGGANQWDDDWYTAVAGGTALTTGIPHPLARLQRLVAVGDKVNNVPVIHTIDKDDVVDESRLLFPAQYTVRNIYTSSNRFWIGLQHDRGGNARIIEWDGTSLTYNNEYDLPAGSTPLSGFIANDIPYFITEYGKIFEYTGGGFKEAQGGDFLFFTEDRIILPTAVNSGIGTYGCFVDGENVLINLAAPTVQSFSATVLNTASRRARSGIHIYDLKNRNLYHHMALGEHASAGTDVNYGTSVYGDTASAGAVVKQSEVRYIHASASIYIGGATWEATQANGIYFSIPNTEQGSNAGRNRGYFITPYIAAEDLEVSWQALWVKLKRFVNSNNRIIVKWRATDPLFNSAAADQGSNPLNLINAPATWATTTTFTCKVPTGVAVGDEVEILTGDNAGCSFNISVLSATPDNSTLVTVTIDEAAPTSSTDTFLCRFDNFKTETAISSTTINFQKVPFTQQAHGTFVQLKVELRGFDVAIDELIPSFVPITKVSQT